MLAEITNGLTRQHQLPVTGRSGIPHRGDFSEVGGKTDA